MLAVGRATRSIVRTDAKTHKTIPMPFLYASTHMPVDLQPHNHIAPAPTTITHRSPPDHQSYNGCRTNAFAASSNTINSFIVIANQYAIIARLHKFATLQFNIVFSHPFCGHCQLLGTLLSLFHTRVNGLAKTVDGAKASSI